MCNYSEKLIALNTLHEVVPPGTHFTAESTEAIRVKCLAQGRNILMPEFEPSTPVSRSRHFNHMSNILKQVHNGLNIAVDLFRAN